MEPNVLPAAPLGLCYQRLAMDCQADALNTFEVIANMAPGTSSGLDLGASLVTKAKSMVKALESNGPGRLPPAAQLLLHAVATLDYQNTLLGANGFLVSQGQEEHHHVRREMRIDEDAILAARSSMLSYVQKGAMEVIRRTEQVAPLPRVTGSKPTIPVDLHAPVAVNAGVVFSDEGQAESIGKDTGKDVFLWTSPLSSAVTEKMPANCKPPAEQYSEDVATSVEGSASGSLPGQGNGGSSHLENRSSYSCDSEEPNLAPAPKTPKSATRASKRIAAVNARKDINKK